ncbi:MAG: hypothetical protein ACXADY_26715 [Candidatus Hodarchaeales archaeon]
MNQPKLKQTRLYLPPPDENHNALSVLGVELENGENPPENWDQYESLLSRRLRQLAKQPGQKEAVLQELREDGFYPPDVLEQDDLIELLLRHDRFHENNAVANAWWFLRGNQQAAQKEKNLDPEFQKLSEDEKKELLRDVNLLEWWEDLRAGQ